MSASVIISPPSRTRDDKHVDLLRLIGFLLLAHGRPERAILVYDVLHLLTPDDEQVVLSLSYALIQSGRPSDALDLMESLPRPFQDRASFNLLRGKALSMVGRGIEAARAMRAFSKYREQG